MDSFTISRAHPIVGSGTVTIHALYLRHKYFLPSVTGIVKYPHRKAVFKISIFVTVSDEAFALSCIANNYHKILFKYLKEQPDA